MCTEICTKTCTYASLSLSLYIYSNSIGRLVISLIKSWSSMTRLSGMCRLKSLVDVWSTARRHTHAYKSKCIIRSTLYIYLCTSYICMNASTLGVLENELACLRFSLICSQCSPSPPHLQVTPVCRWLTEVPSPCSAAQSPPQPTAWPTPSLIPTQVSTWPPTPLTAATTWELWPYRLRGRTPVRWRIKASTPASAAH